jgi:hypothetical protein
MKVKTTKVAQPHAWICTPSDHGRKKVHNGSIFLESDSEFEIELFNPLQENVLALIWVNGHQASQSGLVIRPGQRYYLDCFVDSKKKFKFSTYDVEDTEESKKAIEKNGILEIFFYKEELSTKVDLPKVVREYYPYYVPYYRPYNPYPWGIWPTNVWYTNSGTGNSVTLNGSTLNTTTGSSSIGGVSTNNCYYSNSGSLSNLGNVSYTSASLETGRIEKGESSNQQFDEVDMEFQKNHITSIKYQLLPDSRKPVEVSDISKCSCGKKIKSKQNFCPGCGAKLK